MKNKLVLLAYCINDLTDLATEAEKRDLPVEILVNESEVFNVIKNSEAGYVVGVCCPAKVALNKQEIKEK
jgi:hypothetical protein